MLRANIASAPMRLGLLVITSVPFWHMVESTACSVAFPPHQWKPRVAWEAALDGKPNVSIPLVGAGFNRTLNIDGFCNDVLMNPSYFTCSANMKEAGEFHASVTDPVDRPTSSKITFDNVNCPLAGISIRKTPGAAFEAEVRFQFEFCKAAPGQPGSPVASAAVVVGLTKAPGRRSNLFPWMQEVCHVATTTPGTASITIQNEEQLFTVGKGHCKTDEHKFEAGVNTQGECKRRCSASIYAAQATGQKEGFCMGFAFGPEAAADKQCINYLKKVTEVSPTQVDGDFTCYNITLTKSDYVKSTPAPDAMDASEELTQNLHLREVFAGAHVTMTTAKLLQVQPQTGDDFCFPSAWWFMLQDDIGNPASMPVNEAEWAALMDMVPDPKASAPAVRSSMIVDRVLVKTCNPNAAGWGRTCEMPAVVAICDHRQIVNACVSGFLVPLLALLVVRCVFNTVLGGARRVEIDQDKHEFPQCALCQIIVLCLVAVISCAGFAAAISTGISYAFGAAGCLHGIREMVIIGVATAVPSSLAMIIGLLYIKLAPKGGSGGALADQAASPKYGPAPGHKLVLAHVQEGAHPTDIQAHVINPDLLQTGRGAMPMYLDQHPQTIQVNNAADHGYGLPQNSSGFGFK